MMMSHKSEEEDICVSKQDVKYVNFTILRTRILGNKNGMFT